MNANQIDEIHARALAASPVPIEQQIGEDRARAEIAVRVRPVHQVLSSGIEVWSWFESTRFVHVIARDGRWFLRNEPR